MRNIPFAFLDEETINQISRADRERVANVNAFTNLAETQKSMRGLLSWQFSSLKAGLEKLMTMSGPNSIANLERALGPHRRNSSD